MDLDAWDDDEKKQWMDQNNAKTSMWFEDKFKGKEGMGCGWDAVERMSCHAREAWMRRR